MDGLQLAPTLANFSDRIVLSNHSDFTCEIEESRKLGNIEDVEPVCEPQKSSATDVKAKLRQLLTLTSRNCVSSAAMTKIYLQMSKSNL